MSSYNFVHLHLHTKYSLLDGAVHIDKLAERLRSYGMTAAAMTDHGNMFGAIDFYQHMMNAGIKPIIGIEAYITNGTIGEKNANSELYHIVLLSKDQRGYKNLLKLSSVAHLEGFYGKPRIDKTLLSENHEGLIAMSACLHGEIASKLLSGKAAEALAAAEQYREIFKDDFFLEVQSNGIKEQLVANNLLYDLSANLHIPLVATNDVHYLDSSDAKAHDALLCIQTKKKLSDADRLRFSTQELYLKTREEMAKAFSSHPEALESTWEIATRCNLEIELGTFHFPEITIDDNRDYDTLLAAFSNSGLDRLVERNVYIKAREQEYRDRLVHELDTIRQTKFSGYFLIVKDMIDYARAHDIPVGPGRGSAAGSLVAYSIGITGIDPIKYGLYFERFLNKNRISMPDIDIDFCADKRDMVIDYLKEKYGAQKVARITAFHALQSRGVVRDVGRVLDIPNNVVDVIAKAIPQNMPLAKAVKIMPQLEDTAAKDKKIREMLDIALKLEDLLRDKSLHASGVVISDRPLYEYLPLYRDKSGNIVTGFEGKYLEKIGLIKFDLLALATMTVIDKTKSLIKQYRNVDVDLTGIDLDDPKLYEAIQKGDSITLFQFESTGMQNTLKKIKPSKIDDMIAVNAIYRPGPMQFIDDFVKNKEKGIISHKIPALNDILKETYGVILYQEQVMRIASGIAGFSLEEADDVRKVISKKEGEKLPMLHEKFVKGAVGKGMKKKDAEEIFSQLKDFAEYAFNKSHSAAYAIVGVWTAYLKTYYPIEFLTANLSNLATKKSQQTAKLSHYINYCKKMGIQVLGPDINKSNKDFSIDQDRIRFGFLAIKNVGEAAIDAILDTRKQHEFESFWDFLLRVDQSKVNRKVVESLIKSGAFDFTGSARAALFGSLDVSYAQAGRMSVSRDQNQLFSTDNLLFTGGEEGVQEWGELEKLAYEKELLDVYISGTPLRNYSSELSKFTNAGIGELMERDGESVTVGGMMTSVKEVREKRTDKLMAFGTLSDDADSVEVVMFSSLYDDIRDIVKGNKPVLVKGIVRVEERNDESAEEGGSTAKIIAGKVFPVDQAGTNLIDEVHIEANFSGLTDEAMSGIKDCLNRYRGQARVYFECVKDGKKEYVLELPDYLKIAPDKRLFSEIKNIIGDVRIYSNKQ
ncbi:MAG: DNA polymerase III subunit alpha [Deltaproteobacteria bacterium]|nr:DNA polymerase III subunit alpha [Deltaproteobacteria bacterium]